MNLYHRKVKSTSRGTLYSVHLDTPQGDVLLDGSRDPEHDAARALVERGYTGPFTVYAPSLTEAGKWTHTLHFESAEEAAKLTAQESGTVGPRVVKWKPHPGAKDKRGIAA